jgi:hypothetical protein
MSSVNEIEGRPEGGEMKLRTASRKVRLALVTGALAVVAMWVADGASAWWTRKEFYKDCVAGLSPGDLEMHKKCCQTSGGTWVVEEGPDGIDIYKCINIPDGDMPKTYEEYEQTDGLEPAEDGTPNTSSTGTPDQYGESMSTQDGESSAPTGTEQPEESTYTGPSGEQWTTQEDGSADEEYVPPRRGAYYE